MKFKTFRVDQLALISAITTELERQKPNLQFEVALFNKLTEAANIIVDECCRERTYSTSGMTPSEWLISDDVGSSSRYMITVLANLGVPMPDGTTPVDAGDLGRCIRMVDACNLEAEIPRLFDMGDSWKRIATNWDKLKALYEADKWSEIYSFLNSDVEI